MAVRLSDLKAVGGESNQRSGMKSSGDAKLVGEWLAASWWTLTEVWVYVS